MRCVVRCTAAGEIIAQAVGERRERERRVRAWALLPASVLFMAADLWSLHNWTVHAFAGHCAFQVRARIIPHCMIIIL